MEVIMYELHETKFVLHLILKDFLMITVVGSVHC